jgi:hypothetical protein
MAQLHCYVPDVVAEKIQQKAKQSHLSVSKYLAELVKRDAANSWPEAYFEHVIGRWQGETLKREPEGEFERRADEG